MILRKIAIIIFSFSFILAGFYNSETGWEFEQTIDQAFYIFESIEIDGEIVIGDGQGAQDQTTSYCFQNLNSCDVVGAFLNDVCVGWVYVDSNQSGLDFTTLPVMGMHDGSPNELEQTENYCLPGDVPFLYVFDSSTYQIYLLPILPGWLNVFSYLQFYK